MNTKDRWTIVTSVYDQYELFRQLFESILYNLSVKQVIVVDDYSYPQGRLRAYEDYIDQKYKAVKLIKFDEYRVSFHSNTGDRKIDENINTERNMNMSYTNRGHAYAVQTGIDAVETDFVLILDADCIALSKSKELLDKLTQMFDEDEKCMVIGQVAGLMTNDIIKVTDNFLFDYIGKPNTEGGCPGSPAVACRMSGWKEHGIEPLAEAARRVGWAYAWYIHDVFKHGFNVTNFPIMSDPYIWHVGGGIFCFSRGSRRQDCHLGMCKDTPRYGGRVGYSVMNEWYHGRYVLDLTSQEYIKLMQTKYTNPFDQIQPPIDEKLLYIVEHEVKPKIL